MYVLAENVYNMSKYNMCVWMYAFTREGKQQLIEQLLGEYVEH